MKSSDPHLTWKFYYGRIAVKKNHMKSIISVRKSENCFSFSILHDFRPIFKLISVLSPFFFYLLFISLFCSLWIMINFTFETFQSSDTICPEHEGLIWKTNGGWTGKSQAFFRGFQIILANTWYTHLCFQLFCCLSAQNWTLFPVRLVFDIWYLTLIFLYT